MEDVKISSIIPISKQDVHKFVSELCDENLFLINQINEMQIQKEIEAKLSLERV